MPNLCRLLPHVTISGFGKRHLKSAGRLWGRCRHARHWFRPRRYLRNNGITHKIDPAIDGERDYIAESLKSTGLLSKIGYLTPPNPLKEARTATGGSFHSDGRILVMMLTNSGSDQRTAFADVFCSVLRNEHPDEGTWGDCSQYLDAKPLSTEATLGPIPNKYRVLVLPGFMSSCVSSVEALQKGQEHLRKDYGLDVEYLSLPNDSSENNGKLIAGYLRAHGKGGSAKVHRDWLQ